MSIRFKVERMGYHYVRGSVDHQNTGLLVTDNWDDFSYKTAFTLWYYDDEGMEYHIGYVKIGFEDQQSGERTQDFLKDDFEGLAEKFFSVGQSTEYYKNLHDLPDKVGEKILSSLRDVVFNSAIDQKVQFEEVYKTSLMRETNVAFGFSQFSRVLIGQAPLTNYHLSFKRPKHNNISSLDVSFDVIAGSMPSTNVHALIGRNGVGKTTILNDMIKAVVPKESTSGQFYSKEDMFDPEEKISDDYFSSLVSVSFSAFDQFVPPPEQIDPGEGIRYSYIGLKAKNNEYLKDKDNEKNHKTILALQFELCQALADCFRLDAKCQRWLAAIEKLGSDVNFKTMELTKLHMAYEEIQRQSSDQSDSVEFVFAYRKSIMEDLNQMSSGHFAVLLTISKLVATVEEKTLVLIDEPESHLHPPLLSAFIRALSDLLHDRNGVAIIATHSPVVLQEVPKSCVWTIDRIGNVTQPKRPDIETFGENVGTLTREVFGLEVLNSGFYHLLHKTVNCDENLEEGYYSLLEKFEGQLGFEGRALLKALISERDKQ